MKEIKCRAWDKIDKRMIDDAIVIDFQSGKFYNYYYFTPSTRSSDLFEKDEHGNYSIPIKNGKADISRYIIMQYTKLSDKNGKEIYEGDIVKFFDDDWYPKGKEIISQVHWSDKGETLGWGFGNFKKLGGNKDWCEIVPWNMEVIGNIYENSELLKEETK